MKFIEPLWATDSELEFSFLRETGPEIRMNYFLPTPSDYYQELSGTPNHWYFLNSIAGINGRRAAVQRGGVLQYKLEVYCGVFLSPRIARTIFPPPTPKSAVFTFGTWFRKKSPY